MAGAALAAFAQAPAPAAPTTTRQSFFRIIWEGMEWPSFFIVAGSVATIALIVEHFITTRRMTIVPPAQVKTSRQLIEVRKFRECVDAMKSSNTFFARVMSAALQHARHGFDAMHAAALEKSHEMSGRLFRKVEYLNIMGNLGPLMGLLGTVLGMIDAFAGLGEAGGAPNASKLSHGISLALVNTLLGLALAIVGMFFFGVCRNRVDSLTVEATYEVLDLLEFFRPASAPVAPGLATAEAPRPAAPRPTAVAPSAPQPMSPSAPK
ncbi:MAG: MotA/TolQ/ExbB proton channel family protein [Phycisphaerales bacterium]|nr:MotA/TolQ/ExbB proton channel family protein [Phycisphaerales bacterium]